MDNLLKQFSLDNEYRSFIKGFEEGHIPTVVYGMCDSSRPFFVAAALKDLNKKGVILVSEEKEAQAIAEHLRMFFNKVLYYPSRDFVFENVNAYSREWEHERLSVQYAVKNNDYDIVVTVPDALMQYVMPTKVFDSYCINLSYGGTASQTELCRLLEQMGYSRTEIVEGVGQFSVRGGIVDVFTPNYQYPVRIDFFGDEIDLMGIFDTVS
ncbi:MAG: hypothetical protein IKU23_03035, partial [Clostridia bacterium]|nr:hypothetical protein [Clostridia bacterium]